MRFANVRISGLVLAGLGAFQLCAQQATLFEGARLITGDSGVTIENSAFLVQGDKIARVGKKGEVRAPSGALRVDLTGKTVMPALIDDHAHLGWQIVKTSQIGADTYSRQNLVDHLQRYAYYGIAAVQSMGIDPGETPYLVRADPGPNAALLHIAGRGIAMPNAGPGQAYWKPVAYGVSTEAEARRAVQELAAKKVDLVKIWVDDRNGTVPKLTPPLYRAIIDEAHKHGLRVAAHIYYLADAKELLRSGVDIFAHGIRDRDADDEVVALFKQHPNVYVIPNLPERETTEEDLRFAAETVPASEIQKIRDAIAHRKPEDVQKARDFYGVQARNLMRLNAAGVRIGFGTDSSTTIGWAAHQEMTDMAAAGMSPSQVLTAATKTAAALMKLDQLGVIAAGKTADFLVLDANPLENVNNSRRISKVYMNGKELNRTAMRAMWVSQ
ncbi:MAG TPA: amidohydrolase family protein [Bryobacteraceae bacterium]|nr:amidohydrolase family protein [Bryobacteraceae bacterium]